jgi:hypothetical protein
MGIVFEAGCIFWVRMECIPISFILFCLVWVVSELVGVVASC